MKKEEGLKLVEFLTIAWYGSADENCSVSNNVLYV